jgi:hypothetical protein
MALKSSFGLDILETEVGAGAGASIMSMSSLVGADLAFFFDFLMGGAGESSGSMDTSCVGLASLGFFAGASTGDAFCPTTSSLLFWLETSLSLSLSLDEETACS